MAFSMRMESRAVAVALLAFTIIRYGCSSPAAAQQPPPPAAQNPAVERLGKNLLRVGKVKVNTATREVSVAGTINAVTTLEFLANPPKGLKAYESALTLDTDGVTFNTALILIGLDRAHFRMNGKTIDGDRVELSVEVPGPPPRRIAGDRLIFDRTTNEETPPGGWIYTGSSVLPGGRYWADTEGVLIGFVHNGAAVIERTDTVGVGRYGSVVLNPNLGLQPDMPITLVVKAVGPAGPPER